MLCEAENNLRDCSAEKNFRNIKLILSYDGTDFSGWQRQEKRQKGGPLKGGPLKGGALNGGAFKGEPRTVQGVIEDALEKIHKGPVTLTGAGRTDARVHASAQAANFYTPIKSMDAGRFVPALNSLLPRDVRVLDAREVRPDFHARFDARLRTYRYFFITRQNAFPWELRYAWHLRRQPDIAKLNEFARLLRGEMDCTAFAVPGDKSRSRFRYIAGASFFIDGDRLVFEISANAFLWKMVRSVAGTLVRWEEKGLSAAYLSEVIESKSRTLTGPTAPPEGLFLWRVDF